VSLIKSYLIFYNRFKTVRKQIFKILKRVQDDSKGASYNAKSAVQGDKITSFRTRFGIFFQDAETSSAWQFIFILRNICRHSEFSSESNSKDPETCSGWQNSI